MLHVDFSLCEACTLVFPLLKLIFFMDLIACPLFSLLELAAYWILFVKHVARWFFLCETYTLILLLAKLILFMEPIPCLFLLLKLVAWGFFSSWNLYIDFSTREILSMDCYILIFVPEAFLVWNSLHADFFHSLKLLRPDYCSWNLLLADFRSRNMLHVLFLSVKLVRWFFPHANVLFMRLGSLWNLMGTDILIVKLITSWFLFVKLVASWVCSSWYLLHVDCSLLETRTLIFSSWNWFSSWSLLRADFCSWSLMYANFF